MTREIVCDFCGKKFDSETLDEELLAEVNAVNKLYGQPTYATIEAYLASGDHGGTSCDECYAKIMKRLQAQVN